MGRTIMISWEITSQGPRILFPIARDTVADDVGKRIWQMNTCIGTTEYRRGIRRGSGDSIKTGHAWAAQ
jgi:hypothetical protein